MKRLFIAICAVALISYSSASFAQLRKIPAEVTNAFTAKYPNATNVEWKDKLSGFSANYSLDNIDYTASFSNKGLWESTEQDIAEDALPEVIKDSYSKTKYAEWTIGKIQKIELSNETVQYRVEAVKNDIQKKNLYFSSKGRLLKDKITL